ncbi:MAG: DUF4230 domain-containing protein [Deltaproteobacteria bacterium]|nr:DUF4230 domain-containing protein [Deltaproteobacteria bacterium]
MEPNKRSWSESFRNFAVGLQAFFLALHALVKLLLSAGAVALVVVLLSNSHGALGWIGERVQGIYQVLKPQHRVTTTELQTIITNHAIFELATFEKRLTLPVFISDTAEYGIVPVGHSEFTCDFNWAIKAGFDVSGVEVTGDPGSSIIVMLPEPKILSVDVDFSEQCLRNEDNRGVAADAFEKFFKTEYSRLKRRAQQKAVADGILADAYQNAQSRLGLFIRHLVDDDNVQIEFVVRDMQFRPKD